MWALFSVLPARYAGFTQDPSFLGESVVYLVGQKTLPDSGTRRTGLSTLYDEPGHKIDSL